MAHNFKKNVHCWRKYFLSHLCYKLKRGKIWKKPKNVGVLNVRSFPENPKTLWDQAKINATMSILTCISILLQNPKELIESWEVRFILDHITDSIIKFQNPKQKYFICLASYLLTGNVRDVWKSCFLLLSCGSCHKCNEFQLINISGWIFRRRFASWYDYFNQWAMKRNNCKCFCF